MRFSKTTDYAIRIMVALANSNDQRLSLQNLAKKEKIPRKFLEHVIRGLKDAHLVKSTPGPKGGYQLSREANLISVGQILQAVQGPLLPADRLSTENMPPHLHEPVEKLRLVINDIRQFAQQRLESITLADMAEVQEVKNAHEVLMYYI